MGSRNGSWINNHKVNSEEERELLDQDKIKIGKDSNIYVFTLEFNQNSDLSKTQLTQTLKDEKIVLIDEAEYVRPIKDHFQRKKELIKQYLPEENSQTDNQSEINRREQQELQNQQINLEIKTLKSNYETLDQKRQEELEELNKMNKTISETNKKLDTYKSNENKILKEKEEILRRLNEEKNKNKELLKELEIIKYKNEALTLENKKINEAYSSKNLDISEKFNDLLCKFNSLSVYSSDLQKKYDLSTLNNSHLSNEINEFKNNDIGKIVTEKNEIIETLSKELLFVNKEISNLKTFIVNSANKRAFSIENNTINTVNYSNLQHTGTYNFSNSEKNNISNQLSQLLDNFLNENKILKKNISEYQKREEGTNKKWNDLLKENKLLLEESNNLKSQLNNQRDQYNSIIENIDRKYLETVNTIPRVIKDNDKKVAAQYLVDQMTSCLNDKRKLLSENSKLENNLFEMKKANERIALDLKNHLDFIYDDSGKGNRKAFMSKIEELEDIITQQKVLLSLERENNLEEAIININKQLVLKNNEIEDLTYKLKEYSSYTINTTINSNMSKAIPKACIGIFNTNEIINSLASRLKDKDIEIIKYRNDIENLEKALQYKELNLVNYNVANNFVENQNELNSRQNFVGNMTGSQGFINSTNNNFFKSNNYSYDETNFNPLNKINSNSGLGMRGEVYMNSLQNNSKAQILPKLNNNEEKSNNSFKAFEGVNNLGIINSIQLDQNYEQPYRIEKLASVNDGLYNSYLNDNYQDKEKELVPSFSRAENIINQSFKEENRQSISDKKDLFNKKEQEVNFSKKSSVIEIKGKSVAEKELSVKNSIKQTVTPIEKNDKSEKIASEIGKNSIKEIKSSNKQDIQNEKAFVKNEEQMGLVMEDKTISMNENEEEIALKSVKSISKMGSHHTKKVSSHHPPPDYHENN